MVNFQRKQRYGWGDLLTIMHLLRAPEGCPWDREQTHQSIRRNFLEETYEALDAIDRNDTPGMCEELGDVLLQVVFHSVMEEEQGRFTADDVVDGVAQKLVFRHTHVFGAAEAADSAQALEGWEAQKKKEKGFTSPADAVEAVPHTLPALWRAEKIVSRSVKAGFNWDSAAGALDKLDEETAELRQAVEAGQPADSPHGIREELGDALFILCKIAQMSGVDPEDALHRACDKYQGRFRRVADAADRPLNNYTEAEKIMRQHRWDENIGRLHTTEIIQNLENELHEVGVRLTEKQQDTLMRLIVQYHNGSRLWCLRGWKPNELADMHGNSGVPSISFGPGLQQAFADGIMDKGDLIRKIQELGWKVME